MRNRVFYSKEKTKDWFLVEVFKTKNLNFFDFIIWCSDNTSMQWSAICFYTVTGPYSYSHKFRFASIVDATMFKLVCS